MTGGADRDHGYQTVTGPEFALPLKKAGRVGEPWLIEGVAIRLVAAALIGRQAVDNSVGDGHGAAYFSRLLHHYPHLAAPDAKGERLGDLGGALIGTGAVKALVDIETEERALAGPQDTAAIDIPDKSMKGAGWGCSQVGGHCAAGRHRRPPVAGAIDRVIGSHKANRITLAVPEGVGNRQGRSFKHGGRGKGGRRGRTRVGDSRSARRVHPGWGIGRVTIIYPIGGTPVAHGEIEITVTIPIAPGCAGSQLPFGRGPGQVESAIVIAIHSIGVAPVPHSQVEVAVAIPIAPGQAGGPIPLG